MSQQLDSDSAGERRVLDLVDRALEQDPESRDSWLDSACGDNAALSARVRQLIERAGNTQAASYEKLTEHRDWADLGLNIPNYRLLHRLGSGGMADVYEAERADGEFVSRVAIKVIKANRLSKELLQQFVVERQALANLTHPNIVSMLDGGTTKYNLPYVVMELVDGVSLDRFLAESKPSMTERLVLFDKICSAVEHAHASLIIHRDIKPRNIMVTGGCEPKLLDFGLAKVLEDDERDYTLANAFTPAFASPEQVRGETLSVATDIYSLGAVLYFMITQTLPLDTSELSALAAGELICAGVTKRPSERARAKHMPSISGDLDAITLKAMALEPNRRYTSVSSLRNDLANFVARRPVVARFDSRIYRFGKFISRHRAGFVATSISVIALLGSLGVSTQQTRIAQEQLERANVVSDLIGDILMSPASRWDVELAAGPDAKMSDVLELAGEHIKTNLSAYPEVQVELLARLSIALERLSKYDLAVNFSETAMALVESIHSQELQIQALISHGKNLTRSGRSEVGLQMLLKAEKMLVAGGSVRSARYVYLLNDIGNAYGTLDLYERQVDIMTRAVELFIEISPDQNHPALAGGYNNRASALMNLGRFQEARVSIEKAKAIIDLPRNHDDVVRAYVYMYSAVLELGSENYSLAAAENLVAINGLSEMLGSETKELSVALARQAIICRFLGKRVAANQWLQRALDVSRRADYRSRDLEAAQVLLASWQGEYAAAIALVEADDVASSEYFFNVLSLFEIGIAHIAQGNLGEGKKRVDQAIRTIEVRYRGALLPYLEKRKSRALANQL